MSDSDQSSKPTNWQQVRKDFLAEIGFYEREWTALAACRGSDIDFFPYFRAKRASESVVVAKEKQRHLARRALAICAECPVWRECREDHRHEEIGVWWGTVPLERELGRPLNRLWRECNCIPCHNRQLGKDFKRMNRQRSNIEREERERERGREEGVG